MFTMIVCWVLALSFFVVCINQRTIWSEEGNNSSFVVGMIIGVILLLAGLPW